MEETLEGGRDTHRAVVPLGMEWNGMFGVLFHIRMFIYFEELGTL